MLGKEEPTYRNMEICKCRGQHITPTTKTEGTPYLKGYCPDCKSWVMTEKVFCICCRQRVKHKNHYLRAKRIYNRAVKEHQELVDQYIEKAIPESMTTLECPVEYQNTHYNIPLASLVRYASNGYTKETMVELQDSIQRTSKYKAKN